MVKKILTPTDGSDTAKAAVQFAKDIALAEGAEVVVLSVVHPVQYTEIYGAGGLVDPTPEMKAEAETVVDEVVEELKAAGVKASGSAVIGYQADRTIVETATQEGADLIVMGTHGRTGLARTMIGSVADRVIRHTEIPVVLVPLRTR